MRATWGGGRYCTPPPVAVPPVGDDAEVRVVRSPMSSTFNEDTEEGLRLGYTTAAAAVAVIDVAVVMVLLAMVVVVL